MRHTVTALAVTAVLALGLPAIAQSTTTDQSQGQQIHQTQMSIETHLKAAGYDMMQARQMMQDKKNAQTAREHLTSARQHIQMAQDEAPATMTNDIRRIATSIDQASTVARTDVTKARAQVAKADQELQRLIKMHEVKGGASKMNDSGTK